MSEYLQLGLGVVTLLHGGCGHRRMCSARLGGPCVRRTCPDLFPGCRGQGVRARFTPAL